MKLAWPDSQKRELLKCGRRDSVLLLAKGSLAGGVEEFVVEVGAGSWAHVQIANGRTRNRIRRKDGWRGVGVERVATMLKMNFNFNFMRLRYVLCRGQHCALVHSEV